ncbi:MULTISPECIES: sugar phosphate isomerase/epimerase family protein [Virgibacillus]|uniref:Inosose dehydratase n=2 Tax=Virgibacillus TaxID=84406 RepID=A0A024Q803_9BACI|nr:MULTISPECIES: sugar phosphate isomerase/epimerase family protein [Virgibacillus]EQB38086.1 sugar phosphate isomerase [Virgibacillus sp. CM-4]MYL40802.1 TIM barrel protein [Virgibacillus massiliensis]GGJ51937.1 sugar phosphate isomerase [Virgibacillus kapii]CDQ38402.1 Inosose dehydratase [Virgibacillus massiliensis]
MKVGLSTYSLLDAINSGEMTVLDIVEWIKENGGEHMEIVPYGFTLVDNPNLADAIKEKAVKEGIELSNYALPANFVQPTDEEFHAEVNRLKAHVDLIRRMGIKHMRHDVTAFTLPPEKRTIEYFENSLPQIIEGSRQIADYAAAFGITTTIENHGMAVQHSDRVHRVIQMVDRPNFKTTLDIGNFLCVDEAPIVGVKKNLPYASLIHFKDFYYRPFYQNPGEGKWIKTANNNYLRGSIFGHGDIELREIIKLIKNAGYDGYITLEFEGMEECKQASKIGMANIKRLWDEN